MKVIGGTVVIVKMIKNNYGQPNIVYWNDVIGNVEYKHI